MHEIDSYLKVSNLEHTANMEEYIYLYQNENVETNTIDLCYNILTLIYISIYTYISIAIFLYSDHHLL